MYNCKCKAIQQNQTLRKPNENLTKFSKIFGGANGVEGALIVIGSGSFARLISLEAHNNIVYTSIVY